MIAALFAATALSVTAQLHQLNADLLSHDSATGVLQTLCDRRGPPGTRIRARQVAVVEDAAMSAAARRDLGFRSTVSLREGLAAEWEWIRGLV